MRRMRAKRRPSWAAPFASVLSSTTCERRTPPTGGGGRAINIFKIFFAAPFYAEALHDGLQIEHLLVRRDRSRSC